MVPNAFATKGNEFFKTGEMTDFRAERSRKMSLEHLNTKNKYIKYSAPKILAVCHLMETSCKTLTDLTLDNLNTIITKDSSEL